MATHKELQKALQHPYDRMLFIKGVLHPVFGTSLKLLERPQKPAVDLTKTEADVIDKVLIYGSIDLESSVDVTCYEVTLQSRVRIEQSRVAIQQYVRKLLISGQAALINFVAPLDKDMWRFTLVAKDSKVTAKGVTETVTHPKRYTYLVEKDRPNRTMAERLESLSLAKTITLESLIQAFSVEAMTKAFFDEYKEHYQNFVAYLTGKRLTKQSGKWVEKKTGRPHAFLASMFNGDEKAARDFIKKLLGRIVFLYFVQKKRWLGATTTEYKDGSYDFLYDLFTQTGGDERFFPVGLSELFFNALNTKRKGDDWKLPTGQVVKVPYLNGGLFERDEIDEKIHKKGDLLTFPPGLFSHVDKMDTPNSRGFLDFLNAYNFTVFEDSEDDHTVAVDPEMLGHIFENLLEDNKDKGAFYTPKEIVRYMCQESLFEYLKTYLQTNTYWPTGEAKGKKLEDDLHEFVTRKIAGNVIELDGPLAKALRDVKICDPAIGSGAFPMGLLSEIFHCVQALHDPSRDKVGTIWGINNWQPHEVKKHIIQNSIYGVDIEKGAVDIARLRFWLSLIVDEPTPTALPNLDYKIVVGNSLVSKLDGEIVDIDWKADETSQGLFGAELIEKKRRLLERISLEQREIFNPESDKKKLTADVRKLKIELLENQLQQMIKLANQDNAPKEASFTDKKKFVKATENYHRVLGWKDLLKRLKEIKAKPDAKLEFFDWRLDFPEIMNAQIRKEPGFDIVIANPPYMRVQEIERTMPEDKVYFEAKFKNAKASYDLANLFFELAVNLSHSRSTNCFIFPHKFFNAASAEVFRDYLWKGKYVDRIVHFGANMIFEGADTYTCITHFSPQSNEGFYLMKLEYGEDWKASLANLKFNFTSYIELLKASKLYGTNQWIFFKNRQGFDAFEKIYARSKRFENTFLCFVGLQTSHDKLYLIKVDREDSKYYYGQLFLNEEQLKVEKKYFKPMLRGKDVHRFERLSTDIIVFFPYEINGDKLSCVEIDKLKSLYPGTYDYVMKYAREFKGRENGKARTLKPWYAYIYPKNLEKFEQPKLSSMEICSKHPNVTLNMDNLYHPTTVYSWVKRDNVKESYEYFLAIANSSLLWWFLKNTGDTLQGDARRLKTNYLNPFPLPSEVSKETDKLLSGKVKEIMRQKTNGRDTEKLEKAVDALVCKLYGLSYEEAIEVDPELPVSEREYATIKVD